MNPPSVSIVVPCYNSADFVEMTLDSIKSQTLSNFECLMVNDGSTDDTLNILKSYARADKRFRLVNLHKNVGLSAARNNGLRAARARYITFLDSDDLLMPRSLEVRLSVLIEHSDVSSRWAGVYCGSLPIREEAKSAPSEREVKLPDIGFINNGGKCPFNANQPMFVTEVLRKCGGFDETLPLAEDADFWYRILRTGYWFKAIPITLVTYRKRAGSGVRSAPLRHLQISMGIVLGEMRNDQPTVNNYVDMEQEYDPNWACGKPFGDYLTQVRSRERVMEFCGMQIAKQPEDVPQALEAVNLYLPDLKRVAPPGYSISAALEKGVVRQIGEISDEAAQAVQELVTSLETSFSETSPAQADDATCYDVVFLPHREYHVWTISLMLPALKEQGLSCLIVNVDAHQRDGGVDAMVAREGLSQINMSEFLLKGTRFKSLAVFNDWDRSTRPVMMAARFAGIPTIGIVEGIQDYHDMDISRLRYAYQAVDHVLLPGAFDRKYFDDIEASTVHVAGIPRIGFMRNDPKPPASNSKKIALINSNFSYGVLVEHRDAWLTEAVEAALEAGFEPVISRHPADVGELFPEYVSDLDFYSCLEKADITVQRFASGILEALAWGRPVVYHNSHGERVDKFADPMGAYPITRSKEALVTELVNLQHWKDKMSHPCVQDFLDQHTGPRDRDIPTAIATSVSEIVMAEPDENALRAFFINMQAVDIGTNAMTDRKLVFENMNAKKNAQIFDKLLAESKSRELVKPEIKKTLTDASWRRAPKPFSAKKSGVKKLLNNILLRSYKSIQGNRMLKKIVYPIARFYKDRIY